MRDPHYRKILEGLAGLDDWQKFEDCAVDLLRDAYSSLVPVHGGHDLGMDGAIADAEAEAYPLVVTTAQDVIGNLTRNLDSYLAGGGPRRRVVVATSTELSATRRKNLETRAREKGFVLIQIHDRRDIANRLYRNSDWAQSLLGVSGDPPALSAIPRRYTAPREGLDLVGRDADLDWLRQTSGDRLVVGQPGSGKTALLLRLVRAGRALFLANGDDKRIANACRDLRPQMVIVDDAHLEPERLEVLRHIRQTIDGQFGLVATTWPGAEDEVAKALGGIESEHVRRLELLTRAEILEVLRNLGIQEPDDDPYLRMLVDESANKPGLAVTLGSLWLRGEWREVLTGGAIRRTLIPALKRVLEHDPTQLLACFALGGDRGMSLAAVGRALGEGLGEVRWQASRASHGGVLSVRGNDSLAVQPEVLRSALIQEVFLTSPALPYLPLVAEAPSKADAVETLARAALRQIPVPIAELRELVAQTDSPKVWRHFAALGEQQGEWVLEHFPGDITAVAGEVLDSAPRVAIRRLLDEAAGAEGPLHSQPSHPLRILQDWVQDLPGGQAPVAESLRRRRCMIEEGKALLASGQGSNAARRALFFALSPRLQSTRATALGRGVLLRQGALPVSTLPEMFELWELVREEVRILDSETWAEIRDALHYWIYPGVLRGDLLPEDEVQMRAFALRVLRDLTPFAEGHPGLTALLVRMADEAGSEADLEVDPEFEILFPTHRKSGSFKDQWEAQREAARELAERWKGKSPEELARDLGLIVEEARGWGHPWPGHVPFFCSALVEKIASPEEYLEILLDRSSDPLFVSCFLRRTVDERRPGWEQFLERCLREQAYLWIAIDAVLTLPEPTDRLLDLALDLAEPQVVENACHTGNVPARTLASLLAHQMSEIALAAAVGEWLADPSGEVREEVRRAWRQVVLRVRSEEVSVSSSHGYWLEQILGSDPTLAFDWIRAQISAASDQQPLFVSQYGLFPSAIRALNEERRLAVLDSLSGDHFGSRLFQYLIDESPTLYLRLLDRSDLRQYHLAPLAGKAPDSAWIEMAGLALEARHDPREIAEVAFHYEGVISGFGVEHWKRWEDAFKTWACEAKGRLREVAHHGLNIAQAKMEAARAEERQFELTGRD